MAEIYKLKKGSSSSLTLRYAGDLADQSDYFAQVIAYQSGGPQVLVTIDHIDMWESVMSTFPAPPHDFANAYENDSDFKDFINNEVIYTSLGRSQPQAGDVIIFDGWDHIFVFSDSNIVWNVKKGNQEVYRVKKGEEVVFQRQYLRGYGNTSLSRRLSSTGTSITWRLTNWDSGVPADTYANVTENEIPSLDFSSGYKRGIITAQPLSYNDFTTSNLNDGSRYYCRAGLKHPTRMIMPIIENSYSSYNLPIAAPTPSLKAVTENSATIEFTNNSSTKTIDLFAGVGTSTVSRTLRGTIAPGQSISVKFSGLYSSTTYRLYYYASYVIQNSSPQTLGTWFLSSSPFSEIVEYSILEGGSCTLGRGTAHYSTVTGVKAECFGYKPGVPAVLGYLPGPGASNYYTEVNYFTTLSAPSPTKWTSIGTTGAPNYSFNRGTILGCDIDYRPSKAYLDSNYAASNYAVGTIVQVTSRWQSSPGVYTVCTPRFFRADL